jgi:hypothetical protein
MNKKLLAIAAFTMVVGSTTSARAQDVLGGDQRLACEAMLCLASVTRPAECAASLTRYFSISLRRFRDTVRARANFLRLCPVSSQQPQTQSVIENQEALMDRCDAQSLNTVLMQANTDGTVNVNDQLPEHCSGETVRYVGTPGQGGHWVDAAGIAATR